MKNSCKKSSQWPSMYEYAIPWWRHRMETFSALLAICAGNSQLTGEFPAQRRQSFDVFFHMCPNKRLSNQSRGCWFETPSSSLWRHCNTDCDAGHMNLMGICIRFHTNMFHTSVVIFRSGQHQLLISYHQGNYNVPIFIIFSSRSIVGCKCIHRNAYHDQHKPFNLSPPSAACVRQWIGSALVQTMACRRLGDKPLSIPMLGYCQLGNFSEILIKI